MKWRALVLILVSAVALTGCLRQAAEPFQPVSLDDAAGQAVPIQPTDDTPFEVIAPTETPLPFDVEPDDLDGQTPPDVSEPDPAPTLDTGSGPIIVTVPPSPTPTATEQLLFVTTPTPDEDALQAQPTFVTPGSPLLPTIAETPLPTFTPTIEGQPSLVPTPTDFADASAGDGCTYIVRSGDTLFNIALNNNTSLAALRRANPQITGDLIRPGQTLTLPGCGDDEAAAPTSTPAPGLTAQPGQRIHTVARNETLFIIAQRYGVTVQAIVNANNLTNPNRIDIGQQLIIPGGE